MTAFTQRAPAGRYRFRHVAHMEWIKLRTLRSTWWALAITAAGGAVMAVVIGLNTISRSADLTNNVLAGVIPGLLLIGVLGVLVMTTEYSSGMIRATLTASPRRPLLLAAKAAVFGAASLVVGEAAAFLAFFAGGAAFRHGLSAPSLSHRGCSRRSCWPGPATA
jgi:ABC-2 type transport system permease protein